MMEWACIVCGHDITGRWPAQVCSMLCRAIAQRRRRARKPAAYFRRRWRRRAQKKALARAAQRALRAKALARKRQEVLLRRQQYEARRVIWALARKLRDLSVRLKRQRRRYQPTLRERQRVRQGTLEYRLKARKRERVRSRSEMAVIYSLRELGWLRGYDLIRPGERTQLRRASPQRRCPMPRTKYRRFIWAYADRFQASAPQEKQLLVHQFYIAFRGSGGKSHRLIEAALRRTEWPVCPKLIIVNASGVAKVGPKLGDRRPERRLRDQQHRSKRRAIVEAVRELGLMEMAA